MRIESGVKVRTKGNYSFDPAIGFVVKRVFPKLDLWYVAIVKTEDPQLQDKTLCKLWAYFPGELEVIGDVDD